ncbi:filamentous hemagglutinin N-terminal domain-containing protein [Trinickia sp. Y13]|uniref:two-partner secretion domain-containing protein n=1 Tax=Trinickia sp. Y13 TaxID=2917807 RepID=UPI0024049A90|nr:filamentous hemagglutinin N-terminal domain-containing protein [Trinickia sp. Y13]MDG0022935.1 filamentous hemagglutinin N-terminal domain-containing protein [Trinickia sp. Y13]
MNDTISIVRPGNRYAPRRPRLLLAPIALGILSLCIAPAHAGALPGGGSFVAGAGSIASANGSLTINQTTNRGVIDWNSFSIGSGNHVVFNNGSGATLNRVTGTSASNLYGTLSATGSVYLINPQGVVVGSTGVVSTGGRFLASTLDTSNDAFMQGGPQTFAGNSNARIVNFGKIGSSGGDVVLISRNEVANTGSISAPKGAVELAAGQHILLQDSATGQQVFVQAGSGGTVFDTGAIAAAQVNLQAADGNVFALAGAHSPIRATGTSTRNGHVWLVADRGNVVIGGPVAAQNADGAGGVVDTTARTLSLCDSCGTPTVTAGAWNLTTPSFTVDTQAASVLARSLNTGTAVNLTTTGASGNAGDLEVGADLRWQGSAGLTLNAQHNVVIDADATIKNQGNGALTLRADASGVDNGGSVLNHGTVDWSGSMGVVSALYDMNGAYAPGALLANPGWVATPYSGLLSQITAYKLVDSLGDLQNVSLDLSGAYALGKDIDAAGATFAPLGNTSAAFTGQFDGMGHTIDRLALEQQAFWQPTGLFGVVGKTGVVRNVGVTNSNASYDDAATGILVGDNQGVVTHSYTTGFLYATNEDQTTTGGLVGQNDGTITRSWSGVSSDTQGLAGGLVGRNNGSIVQSYATGDVTGPVHVAPGGLVGDNTGFISQSYATGKAQGSRGGAGLVYSNEGTIDESFDTGEVNTFSAAGVAYVNTGTITSVYWNKDTTGQTNGGDGVPDANGLTTAQMSNPASFAAWNFGPAGAWAMPAGATHPVLSWQLAQ